MDEEIERGPCAVEVAETLSGGEIAELCKSAGSPFLCAGVQSHFYQKFENEQEGRQKALQDMTKRDQMLELMQTGEWVLEVSLKHSGSLGHFDGEVMWGKNSTDSEYTAAFENQLFDCFRRAYPLGPEGTAAAVQKFQQFCETLRSQNITVAFEAVCREILGDHGQLPRLNYIVVTAVVDKAEPFHSRFRDSRRLIEFCIEWGLPWNETFLFTSVESFQQYWDIYDGMSREGTASEILGALGSAACTALACPVPHLMVQGEILEGMVARMVPKFDVAGLVQNARTTAEALPLDRLATLSKELDDLWAEAGNDKEVFKVAAQNRVSMAFPVVLNGRMSQEATDRLVIGLLQCSGYGHKTTDQLCELLAEIWKPPEKRGTGKQRNQVHLKGLRHVNGDVFIIVHVASDELFAEVNKSRSEGQMPLYRGFVLRLSAKSAGESKQAYQQLLGERSSVTLGHHNTVHLMVKCKTVRYKLMTFVFRKGAQLYMKSLVTGKGPAAATKRYAENVAHYFKQWSSDDAEETELERKHTRWCMGWPNWLQGKIDAGELDPEAFLAGQSYLRLVAAYDEWYKQQSVPAAAPFRGIIFITYPTTKVPQDESALHLVLQARFAPLVSTVSEFKHLNRTGMLSLVDGAVFVPVAIAERTPPKNLPSLLAGYGTDICWLSASATASTAIDPGTVKQGDLKRIFNVAPRWCKMLASIIPEDRRFIDTATNTLVEQATPPYNELELLSQFRDAEANEEGFAAAALCLAHDRPKLELARNTVVVYPSIPGTAKTSLLAGDALKHLQTEIGSLDTKHDMVIIHGDSPEEQSGFWRRLDERIAERNPYVSDGGCDCIFVCDKNCPPGLPTEAPGTDGLHRQIAMSKQKGCTLVFVVPESPGCIIDGVHNAYCLELLAVCMDRVFKRTDHQNLKGPSSPITTTMFYNLYNHVTRERFMSRLRLLGEIVELPIIRREQMMSMPEDLRALLLAGKNLDLRKQEIVGKGKGKGIGKGRRGGASLPPELVADIEAWTAGVPAVLEKHAAYIEGIQAGRSETAAVFATTMRGAILNARRRPIDGLAAAENVPSYCGAFVQRAPIAEALAAIGVDSPEGVEWIEDLHCTLLHVDDPSCGGSLDSVQATVGKAATVLADALFARSDQQLAALRVVSVTVDGEAFKFEKAFPHVTVWKAPGVKAVESNELNAENCQVVELAPLSLAAVVRIA